MSVGLQRGPYKNRSLLYQRARQLRLEGYGYRTIGGMIGVPFGTIRHWVKDILAPNAYWQAIETRHPLEGLSTAKAIRNRLIKERGHRCESCARTSWMGQPITLETHHLDGPANDRVNLRLFCPNCHSLTPNWRNRKQ